MGLLKKVNEWLGGVVVWRETKSCWGGKLTVSVKERSGRHFLYLACSVDGEVLRGAEVEMSEGDAGWLCDTMRDAVAFAHEKIGHRSEVRKS